jgi:hypothetical protein
MNPPESPSGPHSASPDKSVVPGRPTSVTVIAYFLIVTGLFLPFINTLSLLSNPGTRDLMARSPVPVPIWYFMLYAGLLTDIVSGIGMLNRQNWARSPCVIWWGIAFLDGIIASPTKLEMVPNLVVLVVIAFFLFRPKANQYFSATELTGGSRDVQATADAK